jgi:hypothetical protein
MVAKPIEHPKIKTERKEKLETNDEGSNFCSHLPCFFVWVVIILVQPILSVRQKTDFFEITNDRNARMSHASHSLSLAQFHSLSIHALVNATWIDRMIKQCRSNPSWILRSRTCSKNKQNTISKAKKKFGVSNKK